MNELQIQDYLVEIPCLTPTEIGRAKDTIDSLRSSWVERFRFHSVGITSHLDHPKMGGSEAFFQDIKTNNRIIGHEFDFVFLVLTAKLQEFLGDEIDFCDDRPFPGFPIYSFFLDTPIKDRTHFDLQFLLYDWSRFKNIDFDNPLTITVPIELPNYSSGIRLWPVGKKSGLESTKLRELPLDFSEQTSTKYFPYTTGNIYLHSGLYAHAIDNYSENTDQNTGRRITLQAHALFCDGKWRLYW